MSCQVFEANEVKSEAASVSGRIKRVPESSWNDRHIHCKANVLTVKGDIRIRIMTSVKGLRVKYGKPNLLLSRLISAGTTSPPPFRPRTLLEVSQQSSGQDPASLSSGPVPTTLFSRIQLLCSKGITHHQCDKFATRVTPHSFSFCLMPDMEAPSDILRS